MRATRGIVASGHPDTSAAAAQILAEGGNAFDAALAALCAASVSEPLLNSLGGGGFLMARPAEGPAELFDFFVQTPARKRHENELDFHPILADFGTAAQEFHVGRGAMAVPGTVAGIFAAHEALGTLPVREIFAPAIALARKGVTMTPFQAYIGHILDPILDVTPGARSLVAAPEAPGRHARAGQRVSNPDLAATMDALCREGPALFYEGELAQRLVRECDDGGGQLTLADLTAYRVLRRQPVEISSHGARFFFNPPPSPGGSLVAFALKLLEPVEFGSRDWGGREHCMALTGAMDAANRARAARGDGRLDEGLLEPDQVKHWRARALPAEIFSRGTTHLSVADEWGNLASLTASNGEGCGHLLSGTGIMMNNMLGEEDLNPAGFHRWKPGARLASMMCPTVAELADGSLVALGTGGANRIRSAVLQVLFNLFEFGMTLEEAVSAPRLHLEGDKLSFEAGISGSAVSALRRSWPGADEWPERNLFFGGVHAVERLADGTLRGMGDLRRGGAVVRSGAGAKR